MGMFLLGTSGSAGFKGTRKSTPYAATVAADSVVKKAKNMGVNEIEVYVKGPWSGSGISLASSQDRWFQV